MDIDSCYQLGYVIKPHGLHGEVSIYIDADHPAIYAKLESVFIQQESNLIPYFISRLSIRENKAILRLDDVTSIDQAKAFKGAGLYLPLASLPELTDDQFYYHEIVGFMVIDKHMGEIGPVTTIYDAGPQHLLAIDHKGKEALLPICSETLTKVDKNKKLVYVLFPEGLLDLYLNTGTHED